jgi:hypothetical protein
MILPSSILLFDFLSLNFYFPSHLFSLTCHCFSFSFYSTISGTIVDEQKLRPPRSLRRMSLSRSSRQQRLHPICCLICQPELPSTPAPTVPAFQPSTPFPGTLFASWSSSPPIIVRQPIVAEFQQQQQQSALRRCFLFNKPNRRSPLQQSLPAPSNPTSSASAHSLRVSPPSR